MTNAQLAEGLYQRIKGRLSGQEGKIVALELQSGEYFVGVDILDAYKKGRKKHPQSEFFFKRVGSRTAFVVGSIR